MKRSPNVGQLAIKHSAHTHIELGQERERKRTSGGILSRYCANNPQKVTDQTTADPKNRGNSMIAYRVATGTYLNAIDIHLSLVREMHEYILRLHGFRTTLLASED